MSNPSEPTIATGPYPGWELDCVDELDENDTLYSVAESRSLLYLLQQSRRAWLQGFQKFTRQPDSQTFEHRARCTIQIGPHSFDNVSFFAVHYLDEFSENSSPPESAISPDFFAELRAAAQSDDALCTLLQLSADGLASETDLEQLGIYIRSMMKSRSRTSFNSEPTSLHGISSTPWDIIAEFPEAPGDYRILPRGLAACSRQLPDDFENFNGPFVDIKLDMALPFQFELEESRKRAIAVCSESNNDLMEELDWDEPYRELATVYILDAPSQLWSLLVSWVGGENQMEENTRKLADIAKAQVREYPTHFMPRNPETRRRRNLADPQPVLTPINAIAKRSHREDRYTPSVPFVVISSDEDEDPIKQHNRDGTRGSASDAVACRVCSKTFTYPLGLERNSICRSCSNSRGGPGVVDMDHELSSGRRSISPIIVD
ncbi:hypothetical protein BDV98DRAFT_657220 [Pterulicium gracile]|uniref:Uncharacterized protein n=1 Tax=Pterulicium gracile TaxID=1884261 RepID=A0A5C3QDL9_9AGAR|nr:hypothetical protein BDV98DRAFT_657220 [Pterula gracilis]